jgi:flavin-dependent dehydrogenase
MNTQANRLQIILADGPRQEIADDLNHILREQEPGVRVVAIEYNYQAPEYDARGTAIAEGRHGILLALTRDEA